MKLKFQIQNEFNALGKCPMSGRSGAVLMSQLLDCVFVLNVAFLSQFFRRYQWSGVRKHRKCVWNGDLFAELAKSAVVDFTCLHSSVNECTAMGRKSGNGFQNHFTRLVNLTLSLISDRIPDVGVRECGKEDKVKPNVKWNRPHHKIGSNSLAVLRSPLLRKGVLTSRFCGVGMIVSIWNSLLIKDFPVRWIIDVSFGEKSIVIVQDSIEYFEILFSSDLFVHSTLQSQNIEK